MCVCVGNKNMSKKDLFLPDNRRDKRGMEESHQLMNAANPTTQAEKEADNT